MHDLREMQSILRSYGDFAECILHSVVWTQRGTCLELAFDYVWYDGGLRRSPFDSRRIVIVRLSDVEELSMRNVLRRIDAYTSLSPDWGLAEVTRVTLREESRAEEEGGGAGAPRHRLVVHHQSGPWVNVVFSGMTFDEETRDPLRREMAAY